MFIFGKNQFKNMKFFFTFLGVIVLSSYSFAQEISYHLSMPHPETHYFNVEMNLSGFSADTLELKMPVWAPGSYLVREFPKNVNRVFAYNEENQSLKINKINKNTWQIIANDANSVKINYQVYAFELSVRTSFIDLEHAYLNGTSVFMYVKGAKNLSGKLNVTPYKNFKKVSTALPIALDGVVKEGTYNFQFENYDQLVDCPFEIGNHTTFDFIASGVQHHVAIFGEGNYNVEQLKTDMAKIVEEETKVFGVNPNKEYLFIVHNVSNGGGGLEHKSSTTLSVNRDVYEKNYKDFLDVMAHEYFHLWNVKRLRPYALGPFDYDNENYTTSLWFAEGFTSYYADVFLRRAGFLTAEEFTHKIISGINYIEGTIGNKVQPVADASFDAWIKAYRPNENSRNTTVSYYSKGRILAAVFDAMIIAKYKGEKSLDDFMRMMYEKYAVKLKRGYTAQELENEFTHFIGEEVPVFFDNCIFGTKTIDYAKYFDKIGFEIKNTGQPKPYFGANLKEIQGGPLWVKGVDAGSPAEAAGLSPNDVIVRLNDSLISIEYWNIFSEKFKIGDTFELDFVRDGLLKNTAIEVGEHTRPIYEGKFAGNKLEKALYKIWTKKE